jgi:hypothetical protein
MTTPRRIRRIQGLALLACFAAAITVVGWSLLSPLNDLHASTSEVRNRIAHFTATSGKVVGRQIDTSTVIAAKVSPEAHGITVQRSLVDDIQASGLQMRQMSAAPAKSMDRGLVRLSYTLDVTGDLDQWTTFIRLLSEKRPVVFVDRMSIKSGQAQRADLNLAIQLDLSAYVFAKDAGT